MSIRELGRPLGNALALPKEGGGGFFTRSAFSRIVIGSFTGVGTIEGNTTSGILLPPEGVVAMRVAVIGGGGGCYSLHGVYRSSGGGGGCAATKIVSAKPITYTIGNGGVGGTSTTSTNGGTSTASFIEYELSATGGLGYDESTSGLSSFTSGGSGSGGDYNYQGGRGKKIASTNVSASGGGAAAPGGDGGDGLNATVQDSTSGLNFVLSQGQLSSESGWQIRGGDGGFLIRIANSSPWGHVHSGGAGAGARTLKFLLGNLNTNLSTQFIMTPNPSDTFGDHGTSRFANTTLTSGASGGAMGGGGGINASSVIGNGGSGGMVVEWFYTD